MHGGTLINVEPLVLVACAGTLVSLEESLHLLAVLLMPLVNVLLGRLVNLLVCPGWSEGFGKFYKFSWGYGEIQQMGSYKRLESLSVNRRKSA